MFNKPKDMRYVDLAIWIDKNAYLEDCDQQKLFEYLCVLCRFFAWTWRYFSNGRDYDDFAIFSATTLFQRYQRKDLKRIKSILNYIKKVLYAHKAQYQNRFYAENIDNERLKDYDTTYDVSLEYELSDRVSGLNKCEFAIYLDDIPKTIAECLRHIPKKKNSPEFNNIYISCLLTFLDLISLTKDQQQKLDSITKGDNTKANLYLSLYKIPSDYTAILYHLDDSYNDYILSLVNEARLQIKNDLKDILYSQVSLKDLYQDAFEYFNKETDDKAEF